MGQKITWCKHCRHVVSIEKHEPHHHEHDNEHIHMHTADHVDQNNHDHDHGSQGVCTKCKTKVNYFNIK